MTGYTVGEASIHGPYGPVVARIVCTAPGGGQVAHVSNDPEHGLWFYSDLKVAHPRQVGDPPYRKADREGSRLGFLLKDREPTTIDVPCHVCGTMALDLAVLQGLALRTTALVVRLYPT